MSKKSPQIARRTVVKGAAWAVPAVAVGSAAAAEAAVSPEDPIVLSCAELNPENGPKLGAGSAAFNAMVGTQDSPSGGKGMHMSATVVTGKGWGALRWPNPPIVTNPKTGEKAEDITGYRINWDLATEPDSVKITAVQNVTVGPNGVPTSWTKGETVRSINEWTGQFSQAGRPNSGPLVLGAGLQYNGAMQTTVPYEHGILLPRCQEGDYGGKPTQMLLVSIPVTVSFIKGLKPQGIVGDGETNGCPVWLNYIFEAGAACADYSVFKDGDNRAFWWSGNTPVVPEA